MSCQLLEYKLATGLQAAETGKQTKRRELVLSDMIADSTLAALATDMTAVSQVTAFPFPAPGTLLLLSFVIGAKSAAH